MLVSGLPVRARRDTAARGGNGLTPRPGQVSAWLSMRSEFAASELSPGLQQPGLALQAVVLW